MVLPELNVDDRTFDQLYEVLRKQIPAEWTDHNPSDPGVALLELLCWLGEMLGYRMNRVPDAHQDRFVDLLIDPPSPVTVPVTFSFVLDAAIRTEDLVLPAGTRLATDFTGGSRFVFETLEDLSFTPASDPVSGVFLEITKEGTARELLIVEDEVLGQTNGVALQEFGFKPVLSELGMATDAPAPVLFDTVHATTDYDPNPKVRVYDGFLTGVAGSPVNNAAVSVRFDADPGDQHYFVTFAQATQALTVTRSDGSLKTVVIPTGADSVVFDSFGATIQLNPGFDVTLDIALGVNASTVVPTNRIAVGSIEIVSTRGTLEGIGSVTATIDDFSDLENLRIYIPSVYSNAQPFSGTFVGDTTGQKDIDLTDDYGNVLSIRFVLTSAFALTDVSASIELRQLGNIVTFGGEDWPVRHALLIEKAQLDATDPQRARLVRLDARRRTIAFGDGEFGDLPRDGLVVACQKYRLLQGPPALIDAGEIAHLLDPPVLLAGESMSPVINGDASGGEHFFREEERLSEGLKAFRRPYRLVTADDFERVLVDDFWEYQQLAGRSERVVRAVAVLDRTRPLSDDVVRAGHVTVLVVREFDQTAWDAALSAAAKETLLDAHGDSLATRIENFLESRRLITTHVEVESPRVARVDLALSCVVQGHRNEAEMADTIDKALQDYFNLLDGGPEGRGWILGRAVYRSEIFRIVGAIEGVDYVMSLTLSPADTNGDVALASDELPWLVANVSAVRP